MRSARAIFAECAVVAVHDNGVDLLTSADVM